MQPEIFPFSLRWLSDLTAMVNAHISQVPPGWTLTESQVAATMSVSSWWDVHYLAEPKTTDFEVLCAAENGRLAASAKILYVEDGGAYISWVVADSAEPDALSSLLDEVIEHARQRQCKGLGFSRWEFGLGWFGIPVLWSHLVRGLQGAGFEAEGEWVLVSGELPAATLLEPPGSIDVQVEWRINEPESEWKVVAWLDGIEVGECEFWGIPAVFRDSSDYEDWITVEWIGVEKPYQRRGIGRRLFAEGLRYQAGRGVKNVLLWTDMGNVPLQRLAEQFGFRRGPVCLQFSNITFR